MFEKFIIEEFMVEKFLIGKVQGWKIQDWKFGVKKSGVEMFWNHLMEPNVEKQIQPDYFQRKSIGMESNLGSLYLDSKACSSSRCLYRGDKNGESNNSEKKIINKFQA